MKEIIQINWNSSNAKTFSEELSIAISKKRWVEILSPRHQGISIPNQILPIQKGIILYSGGSMGISSPCLQPFQNLDQSAASTGDWLKAQNIIPHKCWILNPLPMNHIGGLMPWWRSIKWGCKHTWINNSLMRDPNRLENHFQSLFKKNSNPIVLSLVPTQLFRLISNPAGIRWLKNISLIWVGGANLNDNLSTFARAHHLKLSPCYGSTETAAMVTAMHPEDFQNGKKGCGKPLNDVELKINNYGALMVRTSRLARWRVKGNDLEEITDEYGWWTSGDAAKLLKKANTMELEILGRIDNVINSGGEKVYLEELEEKIIAEALIQNILIEKSIFLPVSDPEWGERIVAIVKFTDANNSSKKIDILCSIVRRWEPQERPIKWIENNNLDHNKVGKLERKKWQEWALSNINSFKG